MFVAKVQRYDHKVSFSQRRPDIGVRLLTTKEWTVATSLGLHVAQNVLDDYLELGRQVADGAYATERACRRSEQWPLASHAGGVCLKCGTVCARLGPRTPTA